MTFDTKTFYFNQITQYWSCGRDKFFSETFNLTKRWRWTLYLSAKSVNIITWVQLTVQQNKTLLFSRKANLKIKTSNFNLSTKVLSKKSIELSDKYNKWIFLTSFLTIINFTYIYIKTIQLLLPIKRRFSKSYSKRI